MTGKFHIKEMTLSGVNSDLPANQLPEDVYSDVANMEPNDIGMRSSRGILPVFGVPLFPPEHLAYNKVGTNFYWAYMSSDGIGVTDGQTHFDISPVDEPIISNWPTGWSAAQLNGLLCFNNAENTPYWWNNNINDPCEILPGWPAGMTCASLRSYNYNLIAMNLSDLGGSRINQLMWSNSADPNQIPTSWTPLPTNDAGDNVLSDTVGSLVDGQQFRDQFMLFKEHSTYLMSYVGGNFVFNFRKLFASSGILTIGCSAEYLGNVVVLTDGDLLLTDGQKADSLINKRMRAWLFNNIDSDNYQRAFVVAYHTENQVWCCFPENGADECTLALVWDATDNTYGIRELNPKTPHVARGQTGSVTGVINWDDDPQEWNNDTSVWNQSVFNPTEDSLMQADRNNVFTYAVNEGTTYAGTEIKSRVERIGLDFGQFERIKLVRSIVPRLTGQIGTVVEIRIGSSQNDANVISWSAPIPFTIGSSQQIDTFAQGRFIAFSVSSEADQFPWQLLGMDFIYNWQGRY